MLLRGLCSREMRYEMRGNEVGGDGPRNVFCVCVLCFQVIIIEPFFDCYSAMTKMYGGKSVFVPYRPVSWHLQDFITSLSLSLSFSLYLFKKCEKPTSSKDWVLDPDELAAAFNKNTKMIIINTPNNPLGKVREG